MAGQGLDICAQASGRFQGVCIKGSTVLTRCQKGGNITHHCPNMQLNATDM